MKIICYSVSSVHSALVAAAIIMEKIPNKPISKLKRADLPLFNLQPTMFHLHFCGTDHHGNDVFTLGVGRETDLVSKAVASFFSLFKIGEDQIEMINTSIALGWLSKTGEYLASIGCRKFGSICFNLGIRQDMKKLVYALKCQGVMVGNRYLS